MKRLYRVTVDTKTFIRFWLVILGFGAAGLFTGYTWPIMPGRPRMVQPWIDVLKNAEVFNREVPLFRISERS